MNILYAISTKSNLERKTFCVKIAVDLFVRSWVEINRSNGYDNIEVSTSSWGRELKCLWHTALSSGRNVDLFVRSWVEILRKRSACSFVTSTSSWGRELKFFFDDICFQKLPVDLFVRSWVEMSLLLHSGLLPFRRPLREVVSWNAPASSSIQISFDVDLFVRSWVEISYQHRDGWSRNVDLFVRSWVEILAKRTLARRGSCRPLREVVSWNAQGFPAPRLIGRRPLREVVSWNLLVPVPDSGLLAVDLFVRSWVEMSRRLLIVCFPSVDLFVRSWVEIAIW